MSPQEVDSMTGKRLLIGTRYWHVPRDVYISPSPRVDVVVSESSLPSGIVRIPLPAMSPGSTRDPLGMDDDSE